MNGLLCNKQVNFIDLVWTKTLNCKHLHKKSRYFENPNANVNIYVFQ